MHNHKLRLTDKIGHHLTDMRTMVIAMSGIYKGGKLDRLYTPSRELYEKMARLIEAATERANAAVDFMHSADRLGLYGKMVDTLNTKLGKNPKTTAAVIYGERFGLVNKDKLRLLMAGDPSSVDMPALMAGIRERVPSFDLDRPARPKDITPNSAEITPGGTKQGPG